MLLNAGKQGDGEGLEAIGKDALLIDSRAELLSLTQLSSLPAFDSLRNREKAIVIETEERKKHALRSYGLVKATIGNK